MRDSIQTEKYGEIVIDENMWTGSKKVFVNGVQLNKVNKKTFVGSIGGAAVTALVTGSSFTGTVIELDGTKYRVAPSPKWYDFVITLIWIPLYLIWANSALCAIFPVAGGALGGAVSGLMAGIALVYSKRQKSIGVKLAISLGAFVAAMAVNFGIAMLILNV